MSLSKLTIVIPTFYPGKIIKKCLGSLPTVSEIIIIDNGVDPELEPVSYTHLTLPTNREV